jgi:hypothetical protein
MVGGDQLVYNPTCVSANVGDRVIFQFMKNNHTATQSTFDKPCVKMAGGKLYSTRTEGKGSQPVGYDSGFMPNVNNTVVPPPTYVVNVTSTDPMCEYSLSCAGTPT